MSQPSEPARATLDAGVLETSLHSLPLIARGKVRDNYAVGSDRILMVASDRVSAFDRVLGTLPLKGQVLNRLAAFWFERTRDVAPNHVISVPDPNVLIARECTPLPVEMVMRSYVTGVTSTSIWTHYARGERVAPDVARALGQVEDRLPALGDLGGELVVAGEARRGTGAAMTAMVVGQHAVALGKGCVEPAQAAEACAQRHFGGLASEHPHHRETSFRILRNQFKHCSHTFLVNIWQIHTCYPCLLGTLHHQVQIFTEFA